MPAAWPIATSSSPRPWIDWPPRRTEEDVLRRMTMPFEQAAAWGQGGFEARGDRDEARVRRDFWRKAARVPARLPFAEDLLAAYCCASSHPTPGNCTAPPVGAPPSF